MNSGCAGGGGRGGGGGSGELCGSDLFFFLKIFFMVSPRRMERMMLEGIAYHDIELCGRRSAIRSDDVLASRFFL